MGNYRSCLLASAIWMIMDSYKDWQESPVSTTITTHPINELQFPEVTICPPRESNTLVNHPLRKVKTVNFTEDERNDLIGISKPVFFKSYATKMAELLHKGFIIPKVSKKFSKKYSKK